MATIDPKMIVGAGIAAPILYIWLKYDFNILFLVALGIYAWYTFDNQFIHKSEQRRVDVPFGPQDSFLPQERTWVIDPKTGEPVAGYQPPPQYPQQKYTQR